MSIINKTKLIFINRIRPSGGLQIFDLLQLSKKERESRIMCLCAIKQFESWKKSTAQNAGSSLPVYFRMEGMLLRRRAEDAVIFYRMIRKVRARRFNDYMKNLPSRTNVLRTAS